MDKILLFIPTYNCEKQIIRVLEQIEQIKENPFKEVIVVNNRSTDQTEELAKKFAKDHARLNIHVLRNRDNYNLGGSHKVAFNYAIVHNYDYVVVLHGDDQGNIADIVPFIRRGDYKKYDAFLGSRFGKGSKCIGYSRFRKFGNIVYNIIFSVFLGTKITDLGSGLNMYKVSALKSKYYYKFPDALTFNYCMIMASDSYRQNIKFFPISWREEDQVSNVKMTKQAINVLKMLFSYVLKKKTFIVSELRNKKVDVYKADDVTDGE